MDEPIDTTFYDDFTIADHFGVNAIIDTYNQAFKAWHDDYKYITALSMALNHKIWEHYEAHHNLYARAYNTLWIKLDKYALDNLKGEELKYYIRVLD